jgi:hypothetical protein
LPNLPNLDGIYARDLFRFFRPSLNGKKKADDLGREAPRDPADSANSSTF